MRFGFVTCVQLGLSCIEAIYDAGGALDLLVTLPDDVARAKSGRIYLDGFAARHRVPLLKVRHINDDSFIAELRARSLDWLFIIGWSQIAAADVLMSTTRGVLGIHPTLLPVGRGRASIPWAIIKGLPETGVTLFKLDSGVDTGPILAQERVLLGPRETATSLYGRVADAHRSLILRVWPRLVTDTVQLTPQDDSLATVWPGRRPEDGQLLPTMTIDEADALVRGTTRPYPGAFYDTDDLRIRIWSARPKRAPVPDVATRFLEFSDGVLALEDFETEPLS